MAVGRGVGVRAGVELGRGVGEMNGTPTTGPVVGATNVGRVPRVGDGCGETVAAATVLGAVAAVAAAAADSVERGTVPPLTGATPTAVVGLTAGGGGPPGPVTGPAAVGGGAPIGGASPGGADGGAAASGASVAIATGERRLSRAGFAATVGFTIATMGVGDCRSIGLAETAVGATLVGEAIRASGAAGVGVAGAKAQAPVINGKANSSAGTRALAIGGGF